MRIIGRARAATAAGARRAGRGIRAAQGIAGVGAVTAGALVLAGPGWALIVGGVFLLLGAWMTS